jgi:hypothetical protein
MGEAAINLQPQLIGAGEPKEVSPIEAHHLHFDPDLSVAGFGERTASIVRFS